MLKTRTIQSQVVSESTGVYGMGNLHTPVSPESGSYPTSQPVTNEQISSQSPRCRLCARRTLVTMLSELRSPWPDKGTGKNTGNDCTPGTRWRAETSLKGGKCLLPEESKECSMAHKLPAENISKCTEITGRKEEHSTQNIP